MKNVIFVPAPMKSVGKIKKRSVPTGNKKKVLGLFEMNETVLHEEYVPTGMSDCEVDGVQLATDLQTKISELESNGYAIINITPVISGSYTSKYEWSAKMKAGYGFGYGYSYTEGMLIMIQPNKTNSVNQHSTT